MPKSDYGNDFSAKAGPALRPGTPWGHRRAPAGPEVTLEPQGALWVRQGTVGDLEGPSAAGPTGPLPSIARWPGVRRVIQACKRRC